MKPQQMKNSTELSSTSNENKMKNTFWETEPNNYFDKVGKYWWKIAGNAVPHSCTHQNFFVNHKEKTFR